MTDKKSIKILAYVHGYFPNLNAGAEAMLHQILLDLKAKGHEVRVLVPHPGAEEYEGVPIEKAGTAQDRMHAQWADVIFTHLDLTRIAVKLAQRAKRPIIHLVHNHEQLRASRVMDTSAITFAVANSQWIKETIKRGIPSIVVFPPTIPERYTIESSREAIVLINMFEKKGGHMFWQLARIFPEKKFIGVKGGYGKQIMHEKDLPNVTILENTTEIQEIYKKARIVIMPSSYESWGRVAMEAACSGIPVIASPMPGLKESLDYAGVFAEHDNVAEWVDAIRLLDDKETYDKYSKLTKQRSKEVAAEFAKQMQVFEQKLLDLF